MTKYITVAALLAAGSAFANAAVWSSTTSGNSGYNMATSSGFWFNLGSERLSTTAEPSGTALEDTVALDSIDLAWTTSDTGLDVSCGFVLTDGSLNIVAVSETTGTSTKNGSVEIDFDGVEISSSSTYSVWFVGTDKIETLKSEETLTLTGNVLSGGDAAPGIKFAQYSDSSAGANDTLGVWNTVSNDTTATEWGAQFAPVVTIATSAVPEPSAFGLLAGLGALALVASRRRRK